jgi:hypothetical protein
VIVAARVTNDRGQDTLRVPIRDTLNIDLLIEARVRMSLLSAGLFVYDSDRNAVFSSGTSLRRHRLPTLDPGERLVVRLSVAFALQPGQYTLTLGLSDTGQVQDWHERLGPVEVYLPAGGPLPFRGLGELELHCSHTLVEAGAPDPAGR